MSQLPKRTGVVAPENKPKPGMRALGRMPTGHMNKLEAKYAEYLEAERVARRVLWWKFEGIKLRLADNTFLTVDFAVLPAQFDLGERSPGALEMHEVKGFMQDDAAVKLKVAADQYPFRFVLVRARAKKDGGGWDLKEYSS